VTGWAHSSLKGRVALLTGASGGIGKAIAQRLADVGVDVFLTYGRHRDDAQEAARYARGLGRRAAAAGADLEDPGTAATLVERAETELGAIDILVANAGTAHQTDWQNIDLDLWHKTLMVNLTTPFLLAQRVLPGMVERRFGRVLFMSSVAALNGGFVGAHYAASKAGLHGLTHHLAPRVAADGVTVNALAPALIGQTRMLPIDPDTGDAPLPIPVGRLGRPGEVADMAVAMLSNAYLTNKVVALDGGLIPR
jgi:3-oxoacyl-[acyl-carrier protein] reductase